MRASPPTLAAGARRSIQLTFWDYRMATRAFLFAAVALVLAWLVTGATDEGGVAWGERAARVLPLAPACAGLGVWLGLAASRARGEARALAALGRSPLETVAPSVAGGALVAVLAAVAMATFGRVDVSGFYPVARAPHAFVVEPDGFRETSTGIVFTVAGAIRLPGVESTPVAEAPRVPEGGRGAAALATVLAGMAIPLLVAAQMPGRVLLKLAAMAAFVAASVVVFQAAAVRLLPAALAPLPSALLLAAAVIPSARGSRVPKLL